MEKLSLSDTDNRQQTPDDRHPTTRNNFDNNATLSVTNVNSTTNSLVEYVE
jgi:hypothetical protein